MCGIIGIVGNQPVADRLVESGNISYEKAVQEGIKEQQRLVSQTEIVTSATAVARRARTKQMVPRVEQVAASNPARPMARQAPMQFDRSCQAMKPA